MRNKMTNNRHLLTLFDNQVQWLGGDVIPGSGLKWNSRIVHRIKMLHRASYPRPVKGLKG
ncbi:MAG: hypothetical protein COA47_06630 [Robiginitomaculum sp.]|nr:MAG: hypothetical protein COA47_06630 [Robiginitomaculum sp.]